MRKNKKTKLKSPSFTCLQNSSYPHFVSFVPDVPILQAGLAARNKRTKIPVRWNILQCTSTCRRLLDSVFFLSVKKIIYC